MEVANVTFPNGRKARITGRDRDHVLSIYDEIVGENQAGFVGPVTEKSEMAYGKRAASDALSGYKQAAEEFGGALDVGASMATSAMLEPVAGLAGIGAAVTPGEDTGASEIEAWRGYGYVPRSRAGRAMMQNVGEKMQSFDQAMDKAIDSYMTFQGMGTAETNPFIGAAIKTMVMGAPDLIAGGQTIQGGVAGARAAATAARTADEIVRRLGVDIHSKDFSGEIVRAGTGKSAEYQGAGLREVQDMFNRERDAASRGVDRAWATARELAADESRPISYFADMYNSTLETLKAGNFDTELMSKVQDNLGWWAKTIEENKPQQLFSGDYGNMTFSDPRVKLLRLHTLRERLFYGMGDPNKVVSSRTPHPQEAEVLNIMKQNFDDMTHRMYVDDMIRGDDATISAWKHAIETTSDFKGTFDATKALQQMAVNKKATVVEVKRFILGANSTNKANAATTVDALKKIFGENSPEMDAIRREVAFDMVQPLMGSKPNIEQFITRYERFNRNNRPLWNSLGMGENLGGLDDLYKVALANRKINPFGPGGLSLPPFSRFVAVALYGHQIARASIKVSTTRAIVDAIRGRGNQAKQIMHELSNYDPSKPFIPVNSLAFGALLNNRMGDLIPAQEAPGEPSEETE